LIFQNQIPCGESHIYHVMRGITNDYLTRTNLGYNTAEPLPLSRNPKLVEVFGSFILF